MYSQSFFPKNYVKNTSKFQEFFFLQCEGTNEPLFNRESKNKSNRERALNDSKNISNKHFFYKKMGFVFLVHQFLW